MGLCELSINSRTAAHHACTLQVADDVGVGDVSFSGHATTRVSTPHIDRLAQAGTVFTDVHSASSSGSCDGRESWRRERTMFDTDSDTTAYFVQGTLRAHMCHDPSLTQ